MKYNSNATESTFSTHVEFLPLKIKAGTGRNTKVIKTTVRKVSKAKIVFSTLIIAIII